MRPALLRLLKRPSALSVIDSLLSAPSRIKDLPPGLKTRCIRCRASIPQPRDPQSVESSWIDKNEISRTSTKVPIFRMHGIQSPPSKITYDHGHASSQVGSCASWKQLGLQPDRLNYESDIGHTDDPGSRLVDDPTHQTDFSLWLELLLYRQRRYGDNGTLDIWEGLMTRVGGLHLPVDGEDADIFWQSFVNLGFKREVFLADVVDYAAKLWDKKGKRWPKLYHSIVGGFIERGWTLQAVKWHKRLQNPHFSNPGDIIQCFNSVIFDGVKLSRGVAGSAMVRKRSLGKQLSAFRAICREIDGHLIYGPVLSALVERGEFTKARQMHVFLTERGDRPQSYEECQPLLKLVKYLRKHGPEAGYARLLRYLKRHTKQWRNSEEAIDSTISPTEGQFPESNASDWFAEKQFKDDFGARVFATKALDFDMILSGLKMFGVPAIGPQSLREMATRARGSHDLLEKLERLEKAGISFGNSVFARLLRKLATENREITLSDLLHSDQHPDMLENPQIQESLLVSYYSVRDWRQYNLTLAVLKELLGEGPELSNVHVRKHIAAGERTLTSKVIDDMLSQGFIPTDETITFMVKSLLTRRRVGNGPVRTPDLHFTQELAFVFRVLQRIAQEGGHVLPKFWIELLKRYGMTDCWDELRACCLWLARHYSSSSAKATALSSDHTQFATAAQTRDSGQQMLKGIFDKQMQNAIVTWGFIIQPPTRVAFLHATGKDGERLVPYARGVLLLRELKQMGIQVRPESVCQACRKRLNMLYGRPVFSNRRKNRVLRKGNPYMPEQVLSDLNHAWGEPYLFGDRNLSVSPPFVLKPSE